MNTLTELGTAEEQEEGLVFTEEQIEELSDLEYAINGVLQANEYLHKKYGEACVDSVLNRADEKVLEDLAFELQSALEADLEMAVQLNDILLVIHGTIESFKKKMGLRDFPVGSIQVSVSQRTAKMVH